MADIYNPDPHVPARPSAGHVALSCTDKAALASAEVLQRLTSFVWGFFFFLVFVHSPGHPVRRCAGPPFWPVCCLSPGRSEPCACRWRPQPRPALTLRFLPTVGSRRSRRRAAWSLRVTYSFRIKEPELKEPEISKKKKKKMKPQDSY